MYVLFFLSRHCFRALTKGLRATDVEGMRALGVSLPRVAALISEAFCEQV